MSVTLEGSKKLWTPEGEVSLTAEVVTMTPEEGKLLKDLHALAQKYKLGLHCSVCNKDLQGGNHGREVIYSVTCGCREYKLPRR